VIHHFRGDSLVKFLHRQDQPEIHAFLHYDFQPWFLAPVGSWFFHLLRMVYGAALSRLAETKLFGAFVLLLMLSMEMMLNFLAARRQGRQIGDLLSERPS
jgi:hypothetical protein